MAEFPKYKNFAGSYLKNGEILHLQITAKTMKVSFFDEILEVFKYIDTQKQIRCIIFTSNQKHFSTGLDLNDALSTLQGQDDQDVGRKAIYFNNMIRRWANAMATVHDCQVPVIAGVDSLCIGGAVNLISWADIRVCTEQAKFTVKEIDIGICPDIGATQRLPLICSNDSKLREILFTGRFFDSKEAQDIGLVSNVYKNKEEMLQKMIELATLISEKTPVGIWAIKNVMNHQQKTLEQPNSRYMQAINQGLLQTDDMKIAVMSGMQKQKPVFPKL